LLSLPSHPDTKPPILIDDMNRGKLERLIQDGYQPAAWRVRPANGKKKQLAFKSIAYHGTLIK